MSTASSIAYGKQYNTTLARQEAGYALHLARTHAPALQKQGFLPSSTAKLEAIEASLHTLDLEATQAAQTQETATDRVNHLLSTSVTSISTLYNLAESVLMETQPAALESLPPRSGSITVENQVANLLKGAAFARDHQAALAAAEAPENYHAQLEHESKALQQADQAQELAKERSQEAANRLYAARGGIYVLSKQLYKAGRTAFRGQPELAGKFLFTYMVKGSGPAGKPGGETTAPTTTPG